MLTERPTLTQFLTEERRRHPGSTADLDALILDVALACKAISQRIASGALAGVLGAAGATNVQGEQQQKLDVLANEIFLRTNEWGGLLAGMASEELEAPYPIPTRVSARRVPARVRPARRLVEHRRQRVGRQHLLDPARARRPAPSSRTSSSPAPSRLPPATRSTARRPCWSSRSATASHAFTLDPALGEFFLTRQDITVPESTKEFAINSSNSRFWEPAVQRYIDECLAGSTGPREKDFNMRWVASLVAETHRILTRGGVFLYPRDTKDPAQEGRLRLLYEANPIAFLIEQAGGRATTGRERVLEVRPTGLHQRTGFVFGSREEVDRIERYHAEYGADPEEQSNPLYGLRGLYRATA